MSKQDQCEGDYHVVIEGARRCICKAFTADELHTEQGCQGDEHVLLKGEYKCECGELTAKELLKDEKQSKAKKSSTSGIVFFILGMFALLIGRLVGLLGIAVIYAFVYLWKDSKEKDSMKTFWTILVIFTVVAFVLITYVANNWGAWTYSNQ